MSRPRRRIKVTPGSELAAVLEEAEREGMDVILDKDGLTYRVVPESEEEIAPADLWRDYDPEKALAGLRDVRGLWRDRDVDTFIEETYAARHTPSDRPEVEL